MPQGGKLTDGREAADQILHPVRPIPAGDRRNRGRRQAREAAKITPRPQLVVVPQAGKTRRARR